ncbi:VWA domain-containing protein [Marinivivus vitaminiproducens]|uniref:VWA domain-containing protein n=1 Tax=Marinivivus vitaminiproducens TaxID=3035935 RepID=UPI00279CFC9F|nr:VWA domain-containing protein [Geminicoccaceae bacterium SCSIO 64248]
MAVLLLAAAAVPLVGVVGLAADTARAYAVRSRLIDALDQAGLAAGRARDGQAQSDMTAFFHANFPTGSMGIALEGPTLIETADGKELTLRATAHVPTTFLSVLGVDTMTVAGATTVRRTARGMELALVMDNTNSMKQSGIDAMKTAALTLVDILYGDNATLPNFWVSVVPFTGAVNVGSENADWLASVPGWSPGGPYVKDANSNAWKGCVEARHQHGNDMTDEPPFLHGNYLTAQAGQSAERFRPFIFPQNKDDNRYWMDSAGATVDANGKALAAPAINDKASAGGIPNPSSNGGSSVGKGPNLSCGTPILPLAADKAAVKAAINGMSFWPPRGGTIINQGLVWGWQTLSPKWRGLWSNAALPDDLPLDYGTRNMDKVVVILTDGQNDFSVNDSVHKASGLLSDYASYGRLSDRRLTTATDKTSVLNALNGRLQTLCTTVKAKGVILYTIVFNNPPSGVKTIMRNCATSVAHHFDSPDSAKLRSAFRTIGSQLSDLRVSR